MGTGCAGDDGVRSGLCAGYGGGVRRGQAWRGRWSVEVGRRPQRVGRWSWVWWRGGSVEGVAVEVGRGGATEGW